ncbi:FeoA domain-containing protein [Faecalibaculum rodentium]
MAGNLIVEVKGSRLALDASMARRIMVQEAQA